ARRSPAAFERPCRRDAGAQRARAGVARGQGRSPPRSRQRMQRGLARVLHQELLVAAPVVVIGVAAGAGAARGFQASVARSLSQHVLVTYRALVVGQRDATWAGALGPVLAVAGDAAPRVEPSAPLGVARIGEQAAPMR